MDMVLIPAYKPDGELIKLVDEIHKEGLQILIVDDGSGTEFNSVFEAVSDKADVIHAPSNEGKGCALKRGIKAIMQDYPECKNFITADADGQHKVKDILRVQKKLNAGHSMVLTMRTMKGKIPARSMFGNILSRWIYTILTGHNLVDNQSGLRGFSTEHVGWLLNVAGDKYDYEINVLYHADKQHIDMATIPIDAIYIDGNKSSHFNPVRDTLRIYRQLFTSARASLINTFFCGIFVIVVSICCDYNFCIVTVPIIGILSGIIGVVFNKIIFRKVGYKDGGRSLLDRAARFTVYTLWCFVASLLFPEISYAVAFFIIALLIVPIRYYIHKLIWFIRLRK